MAEEQRFFAGLRLPNGTFKITSDRRLDDLNEEIARHLPDRECLRIKDVAVSSGISTLEWCNSLTAMGVRFEMTATDRFVNASLIEARGGLSVLAHDGVVLQIDVAGFAFRPDQVGRRSRVLYALPLLVARHRRLLGLMTRRQSGIPLVSPRLVGISVKEEDLLSPVGGQWDVVRAANVLNRVYFPDSTLRMMLRNLAASVSDGGLLAICRTDQDVGNKATIFRVADGGLTTVGELNGGSEVAGLALPSSA